MSAMRRKNSYQKEKRNKLPQQNRLLDEFVESLAGKAETTVSTYQRELRQFLSWIAARPGNSSRFRPENMTRTALETYLIHLERAGHSISHRARVKSAVLRQNLIRL